MRKSAILFAILLLCSLRAAAQQKIYIKLSNDSTLEYYTWEVRDIRFAPVQPLVPPAAPQPVDLGLSAQWSSYNLGAEDAGGTGFLVGWGETTGLIHVMENNYYPTRIVTSDIIGGSKDIATQMWGSEWRLPSAAEFQELLDSCTWEWDGGGFTVTGKNGASIFLPAVGHLEGTDSIAAPTYYWTGQHAGTDSATVLRLDEDIHTLAHSVRWSGNAVRPVYGVYRLPVEVAASEATGITRGSANVTVTLSGYLNDITSFGVMYAATMDSITNNTAKTVSFTTVPESKTQTATINGLAEGCHYFYRAYAASASDTVYSETRSFQTTTRFPVADYVDLGLPSGTKWATWNMGAEGVADYGEHIGWGDVTAELTPSDRSNAYAVGNTSDNIASNPAYDIVNAKWGGYWHIPTVEQFKELASSNYTTWEEVNDYQGSGISGYVVTSITYPDRSIFLPMAGFKSQSGVEYENGSSYYWTANYDLTNTVAYAIRIYGAQDLEEQTFSKPFGFSIRGVYSEPVQYPADSAVAKNVKAVDLGLSVDWADQNIKSPANPFIDGYFTWGSTVEQANYTDNDYPWLKQQISEGDLDTLPADKDAAVQLWGGTWRMPTLDEMMELIYGCTWTLTTDANGVRGYRVTGTNGNSIFLPLDGHKISPDAYGYGTDGVYWTSTNYTRSDPNESAYCAILTTSDKYISRYTRAYGCPIRPVRAKRP